MRSRFDIYPRLLILAAFFYSCLSWLLFFKDEWAVQVAGRIYPILEEPLLILREQFLPYGLNSVTTLLFTILVIGLFVFYIKTLKNDYSIYYVRKVSIIIAVCLLFAYPALSTDIFDYILSDWQFWHCQKNVWQFSPSECPFGNFHLLASWREQVNAYGIVNQFFYAAAGYVGGTDMILNLISHKMVVFIAFTIYVLVVTKFFNTKQDIKIQAVLWNPLLLIESMGNGHNDFLMLVFMLLSAWLILKEKYFLAGILLACSMQVKYVAGILILPLVISLLANKKFLNSIKLLLPFVTINFIGFTLMGAGLERFIDRVIFGSKIYWLGLPNLIHKFFPNEKIVFQIIFFIFFIVMMYLTYKKKINFWKVYSIVIMFYLLFISSVVWPWYPIWCLALMPLFHGKVIKKIIIALSFSSLLTYPILWLGQRFSVHNTFIFQSVIYFVYAIIPITIGTYVYKKERAIG